MARGGARLGLSIDYLTDASRPDGKGGRLPDLITVVGGAVTPKPMNPGAYITEGKAGAAVPVVDVYADAQARAERAQRQHPDRQLEDARLRAAAWIPKNLPRHLQLALLHGLDAAQAKAMAAAHDDGEARRRARWEADNAYSYGLAATMKRLRAG